MSQRGFSSIIFLFIAIAIGAAMVGVIFMANPKSKQAISEEKISPTSSVSSEAKIETVPTSGYTGILEDPLPTLRKVPFNVDPEDQWQTFTDIDRKYSFKYPSLLEFVHEASGIILTYNGPTQEYAREFYDGLTMSIVANLNEDKLSPSEWVENQQSGQKPPVYQQSMTTIGGKDAVRVYVCGPGCGTVYTVPSGNYMLRTQVIVGGDKEKEYENLANLILSTFKFSP